MEQTMDNIVRRLIYGGKLTPKQLADRLGISESYLSRMAQEQYSETYCDTPFRKILAIAKHQNSLELAKWVAKQFGGIFVKLPRVAKNRKEENAMVADYQKLTNKAAQLMIDYFDKPTEGGRELLIEVLDNVMSESAGIRKRCKSTEINQLELFDL